jgi:hypothetical protein
LPHGSDDHVRDGLSPDQRHPAKHSDARYLHFRSAHRYN